MTSSGHVTMPEVNPPTAPANALKCQSIASTAHCSAKVSRVEDRIVSSASALSLTIVLAGLKADGSARGRAAPYSVSDCAGDGGPADER